MFNLSTKTKIRIGFAVFALLLLFGGGVYWYFGYYAKTPDFAYKKIEAAVKAHDERGLRHYVDWDAFLESTTDAASAGMLDDGRSLTGETKTAILDFVKMFRLPLRQSVEGLTARFVRTGDFTGDDKADNITLDSAVLVRRLGLDTATLKEAKPAEIKEEDGQRIAVVPVEVRQAEVEQDFTLKLRLVQGEDGTYRLTSIDNLAAFFALTAVKRREQFVAYLKASDKLVEAHDKAVADIEQRMSITMSLGNLGDQATRDGLKNLAESELLTDWQARKKALAELAAPDEAQTLQKLYLKICDESIAYAKDYAAWLGDKQGQSIHNALMHQKEARTLTKEAAKIRKQIEIIEGN